MKHIFISYSRQEEALVTDLAEKLRGTGLEVWQDIAGKRSGIPYSVKWLDVIEEAIFSASCAIIIRSDAWDRSKPCAHEFRMIRETALPCIVITSDRLAADGQAVVGEAAAWCRTQLDSADNGYRSWMLSGVYRLYKGLPMEGYSLGGKKLIRNWRWLRACDQIVARTVFQGEWIGSLTLFLRKAHRKLRLGFVVRALVGTLLLAAVLWVPVFLDFSQAAKISNKTSSEISSFTSVLRRVVEYDPIRAAQLAGEYAETVEAYSQELKEYGGGGFFLKAQGDLLSGAVARSLLYTEQNRIFSNFLSWNYPTEFYESAEDCPTALSDADRTQTNSRCTVSLSDDTAQVFVYDRELDITRQLLLDAVPSVYCFSPAGDRLLLAAENKVYVYDLLGEAPPVLLSYNFEAVGELYCTAGKIYAVTESGHIVVWDDPLPIREIHRNITAGEFSQTEGGSLVAVYVDDDCLIRNIGNREDVYSLPVGGAVKSDSVAVSSDGSRAAVLFRPDGSDTDHIALVDLSDGTVIRIYDPGYVIMGYAFSSDNASLLLTCDSGDKIARIDLESGTMQQTEGNLLSSPFVNILPVKDRILVCDTVGGLAIYNDALKEIGDYRFIATVRQKQLAVSEKYDCLLTAGRGGNTIFAFYRTDLSTDKQDPFVPVDGEAMVSTTSVAVTADGSYAAYGNAGGSVYIWDIGAMDQVWNVRRIPEAVVNMQFSDDCRTLYILGSSGTVYDADISVIASECVPENPESIWKMHMNVAEQIAQDMYRLGLAAEK